MTYARLARSLPARQYDDHASTDIALDELPPRPQGSGVLEALVPRMLLSNFRSATM